MWIAAPTLKVREDGRMVNVNCPFTVGVHPDGRLEILGMNVTWSKARAVALVFLHSLGAVV